MRKHIRNNINTEDFDILEAPKNHKKRFENKLKAKKNVKRKIISMSIAASLLLLISYTFFPKSQISSKKSKVQICNNQELQDIQFYYTSQESEKISKIKQFPIDSTLYNEEVLQVDSLIQKLCIDLKTAPDNDEVIAKVITHYKMKINTLNHILKQLQQVNPKKENKNEAISL